MSMIKVGVVGCGGIANLKHFKALAKQKHRVKLVGFCDIIRERAQKACDMYGDEGAKVCTDFRELTSDPNIDAIHVLTPNNSHAEISIAALEGSKHVMCEKPMAATAADAQAMLDAAEKSGKKLTIAYQNRFRHDVQDLYKSCRNDYLGDVYFAKAHATRRKAVPTWGVFPDKEKQGGGPLIDIGTHALDIALWTMDNYKPKLVMGSVFQKLKDNPEGNMFGPWDPDTYEVEDSAFGLVKMENGATIFIEASWALNVMKWREAQVTLCGTKAGAELVGDGVAGPTSPVDGSGKAVYCTTQMGELVDVTPFDPGGGDGPADFDEDLFRVGDAEATAWFDAIINDTAPAVLPEQAFIVTQILEAIYKSSESGQAVEF
ncbi:Gfo/Idh/MocA family oxidoreductase [uncultured Cohaesibacter sp.]|uniref:Gfo/Idh/MocA family protein n=1 Tax=uncultured Cohaesibacter sp. TaxID=1002546 RepID=UPI002931E811|nr:Gfo/Idh/MocA family oxidoreductase [uncultured Cohaesibacter sp.]